MQNRHGVSPTIDSIGDPLADRRPLYSCHGRQGLPAKFFLLAYISLKVVGYIRSLSLLCCMYLYLMKSEVCKFSWWYTCWGNFLAELIDLWFPVQVLVEYNPKTLCTFINYLLVESKITRYTHFELCVYYLPWKEELHWITQCWHWSLSVRW